jgi:hypothetical protein
MLETGYRPVNYFSRPDVRMDLLERTAHRTHCPYKGDALIGRYHDQFEIVEGAPEATSTQLRRRSDFSPASAATLLARGACFDTKN